MKKVVEAIAYTDSIVLSVIGYTKSFKKSIENSEAELIAAFHAMLDESETEVDQRVRRRRREVYRG